MGIDSSRALDLSNVVGRTPVQGGRTGPEPGSPAMTTTDEIRLPGLVLAADDATFSVVLEISSSVPVLVCLVTDPEGDRAMVEALSREVTRRDGRAVLVTVDSATNPQLSAAFRVADALAESAEATPVVGAILGGQPMQLFAGSQPEDVLADLLNQLLELGERNGLRGRVVVESPAEAESSDSSPAQPALPPLHEAAFEALERGDFAGATSAYEQALRENPRDDMARAGLAQVSLLTRLDGKILSDVRAAAAANPLDVDAALDVADADVAGGHVDDAFDRLLTLFSSLDEQSRSPVRTRLLDLFLVVGVEDPRVAAARSRLASLLF